MDSRLSGSTLKDAFITGMMESGAKIYDCNMASTPTMFMTTTWKDKSVTGAIMITASHLPFNRNGFKFFTKRGGLDKNDISAILKIAENDSLSIQSDSSECVRWNFIDEYADFLVDYISKNAAINDKRTLEGLKIIVDAGNGAGGFFTTKVLDKLGADTTGSQFLNPDRNFPNHVPNPENYAK